jgi:hypothetical protein
MIDLLALAAQWADPMKAFDTATKYSTSMPVRPLCKANSSLGSIKVNRKPGHAFW